MSKWIDADALKKHFPHDNDWEYPVNTNEFVVECIDSAPCIDIVRCKECKYWQDNLTEDNSDEDYLMCKWNIDETPDADDFCSYGERPKTVDYNHIILEFDDEGNCTMRGESDV